ncbi:UNVERIFIED_CONTAM: hypothetical protein PYX00_006150 [Menopon gallinae]|uniref:RecQ-mediated genome instability protein 1 n=1 Tax=Menopon gallinae TaxID=328185 RepID=A0AAW2HUU0_9NEOP
MQSSDFQKVSTYLNSLNIHYPSQWLLDCINQYKSTNPNISSNELTNSVYQKWLSTNLRELKTSSLPSNISSQEKITLPGKYVLQVESMVNSAKSCYSELQRIRGLNTESDNTDGQNEGSITKRCLTFHLCDGVQEIQGMEYQPLPSIKLNDPQFLPGFKMLIKGPVMCRKGMLLLKEENVKVYGGKVDSLCEENMLELLLCRKLGLKEDVTQRIPTPQESSTSQNRQETNVNVHGTQNQNTNSIELDDFMTDNDDIFLNLSYETADLNIKKNSQECTVVERSVKTPVQQKISNYITSSQKSNKNQNSKTSSHNGINSNDDEVPNISNKRARLDRSEFTEATGSVYDNNMDDDFDSFVTKSMYSDDYQDDVLILDDFDSPLHMVQETNMEKKKGVTGKSIQMDITSFTADIRKQNSQEISKKSSQTALPRIINSYPFVYLKQILDLKLRKPTTFVVKAIILTLKSKISIKNDEFSLRACISDGSHALEVNFCSAILEDILEYSPCEVTSMMNERAQQKLISMNCLMEIKFFCDKSTPTVVKLEEVQLKHINALKARYKS